MTLALAPALVCASQGLHLVPDKKCHWFRKTHQ
jgi:hypothetical protein